MNSSTRRRGRRALAFVSALAMAALAAGTAASVAVAASPAAGPAGLATHRLALLNGWTSDQAAYDTGNPAVSLDSVGIVHLSGSLGDGTSQLAFVLPAADWPASNLYIDTYTFEGAYGYLIVETNGDVYVEGSSSTTFTSLAGISFPSAVTKVTLNPLTLQGGWSSANSEYGTGDPSAGVKGGIVYLSGSLEGGAVGSTAFTLPAAVRPADESLVSNYTDDGTVGSLAIFPHDPSWPHGAVVPSGDPSTAYTSLAGLSFPAAHNDLSTQAISLTNGYLVNPDYGAPAATLDAHGIVHLSGAAYDGSSPYAGTLPAGDCPSHILYIPTYILASGIPSWVVINPDCSLDFESESGNYAQSFTSLATISFPAGL
jgi:hypothetical protein